jgi:hypothetical protein
MNYDEMPAGVLMDQLIATLVLGQRAKVEQHPDYLTPKPSLAIWTKGYSGRGITEYNTKDHWRHVDWSPSRDIRDAWQVVEKFPGMTLEGESGRWWCNYHIDRKESHANGATPALAICRAALKAMNQPRPTGRESE